MNVRFFINMLSKQLAGLAAALLWTLSAGAMPAFAGVILSPVAIVQDTICCSEGGTNTPAIDQSGLSAPFMSGATNFSSYIASRPTHVGDSSSVVSLVTGSFSGELPLTCNQCILDFSLGAVFSIEQLVLWNGSGGGLSVNTFRVFTSVDSGFSDARLVGIFANPEFEEGSVKPATVFDLDDSEGAFLRLQIDSSHGSVQISIGEVALDVVPFPVPEPTSMALLVIGFLLLVQSRAGRVVTVSLESPISSGHHRVME